MKHRALKAHVLSALSLEDAGEREKALRELVSSRLAGVLIGAFCSNDKKIFWHSIDALAFVCRELFKEDREGVREIMRRLVWMLNDESGSMGWGCAEAMGSIMAVIPAIAEEYHRILCSYLDLEKNHMENPFLQQGILWGLARLAEKNPALVKNAGPFLAFYLQKDNLPLLANTLILISFLKDMEFSDSLYRKVESFLDDERPAQFYWDSSFHSKSIASLALKVLER